MKEATLVKDLPYLKINVDAGLIQTQGQDPADTPILGDWVRYSKSAGQYFVHTSIIDIAGLTQQEFTFYPTGGNVQRSAVSMGLTDSFAVEWIIASTSSIDWGKVDITPINGWNRLPGHFQNAQEGFQQTMFGRGWIWTRNTTLQQNFAVAVNTTSLGSGEPTNGSRIYLYRVVQVIAPTQPGDLEFGACRFVMTGEVREEAEYSQIMRMRRTYELQQTPDRD